MKQKLNVNMIKKQNRRNIFYEIITNAPISRLSISQNLHLSLGTVTTVVEELINRGVVKEEKDTQTSVGRKPNIINFVPKAKRIICIDMATRHFSFSLKDLSLRSEFSYRYHFDKTKNYETNFRIFLETMKAKVLSNENLRNTIGIGVSVPGPYSAKDDRISCKLIPEITKINPRRIISEYYKGPILLDHDVKLAATSEVKLIPGFNHKVILYLYLDEGVGSAISINGGIYSGADEFAGEIGQMVIGNEKFENLVSWKTLLARLDLVKEDNDELIKPDALKSRFNDKEPRLMGELDNIIRIAGKTIANIICVLNPHYVILGGKYKIFGKRFIEALESETKKYLIEDLKKNLHFRLSNHLESGPLLGAGSIVRDYWLDNP